MENINGGFVIMENRKLMLALFMKILNDNKSNPDDIGAYIAFTGLYSRISILMLNDKITNEQYNMLIKEAVNSFLGTKDNNELLN